MSELHVTRERMLRLRQRQLQPDEVLSTFRHIAACGECRRFVADEIHVPDFRVGISSADPVHLDPDAQLIPWVDGTLDDADREIVESHLDDCPLCRADAADLRLHVAPSPGRTIVRRTLVAAMFAGVALAGAPNARELSERLASRKAKAASNTAVLQPRELPFIGRVAELEELESAYQALERGTPVTVMLSGQSGMGKSALVRYFLNDVQRRDPRALVLAGRCYDQESVPYKAVASVIEELARYLGRVSVLEAKALLPGDVGALARLFPVLQDIYSAAKTRLKPLDVVDSQELRRRAFAALRELLGRISDERRVVLFLDDVQWGDRDSAALLGEVLRQPDAPPMLVIATHRGAESDGSPLLAELSKLRGANRIALEELTTTESRDLARALLQEPETDGRAEAIASAAGGSPFFLVELSQLQEATGHEPGEDHADELVVDDVIRSRIALLPDDARALLEVVAVAGRPIAAIVASSAAGLELDDAAMLDALFADRLLRTRMRDGGEELDTHHDRIRETILAGLAPEHRRLLHLTIARTLEAEGLREPEVLAVHYRGAGDEAKAATLAIEAGDRAAAALAFDNAAEFYEMALSHDAPRTPALIAKLADALANGGRGADAAAHYVEAAGGVDAAAALELRRKAMECLLRAGHFDDGLRLMRDVVGAVGLSLPETPKRAVAGIIFGKLRLLARGLTAAEHSPSAIPQEALTRIDVCWGLVTGMARIDHIRSAYFQPIHLRLALDAGEPYRVARALAAEACFSATQGEKRRRETERIVSRAERSARATGQPHAIGMSIMARAMESYYLGHFRDAVQQADEAESIFRERCAGVSWEISTSVNYALSSLTYLGELPQLAQRVPQRLREAEAHGDLYAALDPVCRPGILWLAADDPDAARRNVRQVMSRWSLQGFHLQHYLEMLAENQVDLYTGDWKSAWRRADERRSQMASAFLPRVPFLKLEALHLVGRCALAAAICSGDESLIRRAESDAAAIEREKTAWAMPFATSLRAAVAAQRGNDVKALELLAQAARGFEKHEILLYAKAAEYRRGMLAGTATGRAIASNAETWLRARGVKNVPRFVDVLMPGFA